MDSLMNLLSLTCLSLTGPKVYSTSEDHQGYSEETMALAIVLTAFIALVIGLCLGIFVTRHCSSSGSGSSHSGSNTAATNSSSIAANESNMNNEEIHKYSVTTVSSTCLDKSDEFNQISNSTPKCFDHSSADQPLSLPPQFMTSSKHCLVTSQPLSLNPSKLDQQR